MYRLKETGERIKSLRKERGYTQEKLCVELGIGLKAYQAIEQGVRGATIDMLCILRDFFGVSLDYLAFGETANDDICFAFEELSSEEKEKLLKVVHGIIDFSMMKNSHKKGE